MPAAVVPASPPRLRRDLTVSYQQAAGTAVCVLKDPVSGRFFRFGELEQFIAEQLDGETPLEVVRQRTEARFGAALPAPTLADFVKNLDKAHLLEVEGPRGAHGKGRRGRIRGSPLYVRVPLFDPNG